MAASVEISVFLNVTVLSVVDVYKRFGMTRCLNLLGKIHKFSEKLKIMITKLISQI
jgi:hypothetical protein